LAKVGMGFAYTKVVIQMVIKTRAILSLIKTISRSKKRRRIKK
jgi:hypothetical protein